MIIDLHVHTKVLSADSGLDPEEAVQEAKRIGLNAICFTEHNRVWGADEVRRLSSKWDFLVLRGVEVDTIEGHVLVFGLYEDFEDVIRVKELHKWVDGVGGVMIAAHPFKGFRVFGLSELKLTPEQGARRPIFQYVDAIEAFNGRSTENECGLSQGVGAVLGLKAVGGSDAHSSGEIGRCVTTFENSIRSEAELIAELKRGEFKADYFRD